MRHKTRSRGRSDANTKAIVAALRAEGCTVVHLGSLGGGVPDLLVGYLYENWLLEVKDGSKPPSARQLTPAEQAFNESWRGCIEVVDSVESALRTVLG